MRRFASPGGSRPTALQRSPPVLAIADSTLKRTLMVLPYTFLLICARPAHQPVRAEIVDWHRELTQPALLALYIARW